MERRGEGFERERYVPEPGREVRREGAERERIVEPAPPAREERHGIAEPALGLHPRDLTHWGPVWAGFFVSLAVIVLVGILGVALGLGLMTQPGTGAAIWGAVTLIVGFFCGGYFAARTSSLAGPVIGLIQGVAVWAVTTAALLVLGSFGLAGLLGMTTGPMPQANLGLAQGAAWGTFIALILGLCAAAIGGYVGGQALEQRVPPRSLP